MEEGEPRKPSDPREAGKAGVPGIEAGEPGTEVTEEEEDEATRELATRSRCAGRACFAGRLAHSFPRPPLPLRNRSRREEEWRRQ